MSGGVRSTIDGRPWISLQQLVWSLFTADNSESCLSQPAWTTMPKRREQNLIVHSGKTEVEVTSNRRLCSSYCTIEANH